jgi:hypothetical protein
VLITPPTDGGTASTNTCGGEQYRTGRNGILRTEPDFTLDRSRLPRHEFAIETGNPHRKMTAYKNFIDDFPYRCRDILNITKRPALHRGREVTLALMVASAGLVVPYERLKPDIGWGDHPSGDRKTFADAAGKLESLLGELFMSSRLCTEANPTWRVGKLLSVTGDPDSWEGLQTSRPISKDKTVGGILSIIRNALAHGYIWTLRDPIEAIIFVKRVLKDKAHPVVPG